MSLKSNLALPLFLVASLAGQLPIGARPPSEQFAGRAAGAWKIPAHPENLTIIVRNPRCPACLKTLKGYLVVFPGVERVVIGGHYGDSYGLRKPTVAILVKLKPEADSLAVVNRVKVHDLEILQVRAN